MKAVWIALRGCACPQQERFEFDEPDFALIDTLFSLGESHIFMQLVEMHDSTPEKLPAGKTYAEMYRCGAHLWYIYGLGA